MVITYGWKSKIRAQVEQSKDGLNKKVKVSGALLNDREIAINEMRISMADAERLVLADISNRLDMINPISGRKRIKRTINLFSPNVSNSNLFLKSKLNTEEKADSGLKLNTDTSKADCKLNSILSENDSITTRIVSIKSDIVDSDFDRLSKSNQNYKNTLTLSNKEQFGPNFDRSDLKDPENNIERAAKLKHDSHYQSNCISQSLKRLPLADKKDIRYLTANRDLKGPSLGGKLDNENKTHHLKKILPDSSSTGIDNKQLEYIARFNTNLNSPIVGANFSKNEVNANDQNINSKIKSSLDIRKRIAKGAQSLEFLNSNGQVISLKHKNISSVLPESLQSEDYTTGLPAWISGYQSTKIKNKLSKFKGVSDIWSPSEISRMSGMPREKTKDLNKKKRSMTRVISSPMFNIDPTGMSEVWVLRTTNKQNILDPIECSKPDIFMNLG